MKPRIYTLALLLLAISVQRGFSKEMDRPAHEIYSMMMYNFIKYIQWPDNSSEFIIGVIGDDEVFNTLNTWYGGQIRSGKKFIIKRYETIEEVSSSHMLFVNLDQGKSFYALKSKLAGSSTLMITNKPGLAAKGSAINFRTVNNRLSLELNQTAIESANLKISSKLVAMGKVIN